ncbi:MAG: DNA-binding protein [Nitrososphaerota archaeon]|jgi:DNA-binding protein|nr:DNA-binding protein [Nitrososphaerota archaeon]MDG7039321.1 DNA-binding protein [Nitrososphaerota archaeon]MDG7052262.1 DNA-binding protein [Nitrososphaerota archaeon]
MANAEKDVEGATEEAARTAAPRRESPANNIFIGKKPVMVYALSAQMQLATYEEIILRARGRSISRAVDVAEVLVNRLGNSTYEIKNIKAGTELVGEADQRRNVSTIEITVKRK